jgi:mono/diheme cytochrome c family protein
MRDDRVVSGDEPPGSDGPPQVHETATAGSGAPTPDCPDDGTRGIRGAADLEPDVERLHRPIFRELTDPEEGREHAPWWVWTVATLAIFWGGWYLGHRGGSFDLATHVAFSQGQPSAAAVAPPPSKDPVAAGRQVFLKQCQACHQATGQGLPGTFPPLVGSEWVSGAPETVVRILLKGLHGQVEVRGATFNGAMPAWEAVLSDAEISEVATYIRQWKPNAAPPIDPELVARLRAAHANRSAPWTVAELKALERDSTPIKPRGQ